MNIKYSEDIKTVEEKKKKSCINDTYSEVDVDAYRWTFEDINDKRNFLPRALIKDNPNIKKVKLQCDGWSLSFFNTEANAIKRLNEICSDKPELFKKLGTHVSKGVISKGDGICGKVDKRGHFECFEYETTDFKNNFAVKTQVYP